MFFKSREKELGSIPIASAHADAAAKHAQSLFKRIVFHKTQGDWMLET